MVAGVCVCWGGGGGGEEGGDGDEVQLVIVALPGLFSCFFDWKCLFNTEYCRVLLRFFFD